MYVVVGLCVVVVVRSSKPSNMVASLWTGPHPYQHTQVASLEDTWVCWYGCGPVQSDATMLDGLLLRTTTTTHRPTTTYIWHRHPYIGGMYASTNTRTQS